MIALVAVVPAMGLVAARSGQIRARPYGSDGCLPLSLLAAPWNQQWLMQGLEMMGWVAIGQMLRTLTFALGVVVVRSSIGRSVGRRIDGRLPQSVHLVGLLSCRATLEGYRLAIRDSHCGQQAVELMREGCVDRAGKHFVGVSPVCSLCCS